MEWAFILNGFTANESGCQHYVKWETLPRHFFLYIKETAIFFCVLNAALGSFSSIQQRCSLIKKGTPKDRK